MTPSLNPKIKCSFELLDLLYDRKQTRLRMMQQKPDLADKLIYINKQLVIYNN